MQTTTPEISPDLQERLQTHRAARERFELACDEVDRREADLQRLMKALEAAENEASQAREEAVALMRNPDASHKGIYQLKAKERASYTMAEDYRAIVEEQKLAGEEAKLKAGVAKREEWEALTSLLKVYADELAREASNHLAPVLRAMHVREQALRQESAVPWDVEWENFYDSAREAAKDSVWTLIKQYLDAFEYDSATDVVLQAATRPSGLDRFPFATSFTHQKQKEQLEQATKLLRRHNTQPTTEVQQ